MESRMLAAVARGHGLVTARELRELGVSQRLLAQWVRAGVLVPVRRAVYTTSELWKSWEIYRERPLARIRASGLTMTIPHVYSHESSAIVQRLPLLRPQDADVHVTRLDLQLRGSRTRYGVHHHAARFRPEQVVRVEGLACLDVARTVIDIAREHGYQDGLVAADGAMQRGISRALLTAAAEQVVGWPGSLVVKAVVADANPGAESAAETLGRELLMECGFAQVETQFPVDASSGTKWCDLRVGRHLVEVHGRKKSRPVADGGLADRDLEQILWDERRRQREVCGEGFGMSSLVWTDFWGGVRERAKERLLEEYAVTEQRFGHELTPQQAEFAARMRGRRYQTAG